MMLLRTIAIGALLGPAHAQQTPPLPSPMFDSMPVMVPLPPNGCVWAGRPFSDGAGFCVADKVLADLQHRKMVARSRRRLPRCHGRYKMRLAWSLAAKRRKLFP